ncbi:hypothetical protein JXA32_03335 [Candidatus Sumerlaeota bacterium]|nr:hypothetical protein [Candidatus Sumerlaeota bacterium]
MKRSLALFTALAVCGTIHVWPASGSMEPSIAPGPGATEEGIRATVEFLNSKEAAFKKGIFVNEFSTQQYCGSVKAIGKAIETLTDEARLDVNVCFAHIEDAKVSFSISQNSRTLRTDLTINLDCAQIDLSKLKFTVKPYTPENLVEKRSEGESLIAP